MKVGEYNISFLLENHKSGGRCIRRTCRTKRDLQRLFVTEFIFCNNVKSNGRIPPAPDEGTSVTVSSGWTLGIPAALY